MAGCDAVRVKAPHLPDGLDAPYEADVDDAPGRGEAQHQPPLQRAALLQVRGDVQRLPVPVVVHRCADLTLLHVTCRTSEQHTHIMLQDSLI